MKMIFKCNGQNNQNNNANYTNVTMKRKAMKIYSNCMKKLLIKLKSLTCAMFVLIRII